MDEQVLKILKASNAFLEGHFILTSGLHSPHYIEKFRVLEQPKYTEMLCKKIADLFRDENPTVVIGPMTGGIILAYETGKQLGTRAIFAERVDETFTMPLTAGKQEVGSMVIPYGPKKMALRRGFKLSPEDRVLVVEDIITTGGSVREVIEIVRSFGSTIIGLSCLVDRSSGSAKFDVPYKPLLRMEVVNYKPDECPLCNAGSVAVKPGSTNK